MARSDPDCCPHRVDGKVSMVNVRHQGAAACIGRQLSSTALADWLKYSPRDLFCTDRPAGEFSLGDDPGPFGLVAPVNGAGFNRSLGHGLCSMNFIVRMQPAVTGSRGFCVCVPLARDCLIVVISDLDVAVAPRDTRLSRRQELLFFRC